MARKTEVLPESPTFIKKNCVSHCPDILDCSCKWLVYIKYFTCIA